MGTPAVKIAGHSCSYCCSIKIEFPLGSLANLEDLKYRKAHSTESFEFVRFKGAIVKVGSATCLFFSWAIKILAKVHYRDEDIDEH